MTPLFQVLMGAYGNKLLLKFSTKRFYLFINFKVFMTMMMGENDFLYYVTAFCDVINKLSAEFHEYKLSYYLLGLEPTAELGRMAENHG